MFLKFLLSVLLFFSLPNWVLATSCEDVFASKKTFISFAKKLRGEDYEKELGTDWSQKVAENTKHWNRMEVSQFIDFLSNRIGEENTLRRVESISSIIVDISFSDFMSMVRSYDQINKDIIDTLMYSVFHFSDFMQNHIANKIETQELSRIIESYFGGVSAAYIVGALSIHDVNINEIKKAVYFVNSYTARHGIITDHPASRLNYFKEMIFLPSEKRIERGIKGGVLSILNNFSELREFIRLVFDEVARMDREGTHFSDSRNRVLYSLKMAIVDPFLKSFFSMAKIRNLVEIVRIIEEYIEPSEIAKLMVRGEEIYLANPKHLIQVIKVLNQVRRISTDETISQKENENIRITDKSQKNTSALGQFFEEQTLSMLSVKDFIIFVMKHNMKYLLLAHPVYLRNMIAILENYLSKQDVAFMLKYNTNQHLLFQRGLLKMARSNSLQEIITAFERDFKKDEIAEILMINLFKELFALRYSFSELQDGNPITSTPLAVNFFPRIWIEIPDDFLGVVNILRTYIDQKPVLFRRIKELTQEEEYSILMLHEELKGMSRKLASQQITRLLNSGISLSEFSVDELDPSRPQSFH